jgi:hypothetical protein
MACNNLPLSQLSTFHTLTLPIQLSKSNNQACYLCEKCLVLSHRDLKKNDFDSLQQFERCFHMQQLSSSLLKDGLSYNVSSHLMNSFRDDEEKENYLLFDRLLLSPKQLTQWSYPTINTITTSIVHSSSILSNTNKEDDHDQHVIKRRKVTVDNNNNTNNNNNIYDNTNNTNTTDNTNNTNTTDNTNNTNYTTDNNDNNDNTNNTTENNDNNVTAVDIAKMSEVVVSDRISLWDTILTVDRCRDFISNVFGSSRTLLSPTPPTLPISTITTEKNKNQTNLPYYLTQSLSVIQQWKSDYFSELIASTPSHIVILDCEMIDTIFGREVAKITMINNHEHLLLDDAFVYPRGDVLDYKTQFTGIHSTNDYHFATQNPQLFTVISYAQLIVYLLLTISTETIMIGHSLENDLHALRLVHTRLCDTAILYPHPRGFPLRRSLKELVWNYLQMKIQEDHQCHNSREDCIATWQLVLYYLEKTTAKKATRTSLSAEKKIIKPYQDEDSDEEDDDEDDPFHANHWPLIWKLLYSHVHSMICDIQFNDGNQQQATRNDSFRSHIYLHQSTDRSSESMLSSQEEILSSSEALGKKLKDFLIPKSQSSSSSSAAAVIDGMKFCALHLSMNTHTHHINSFGVKENDQKDGLCLSSSSQSRNVTQPTIACIDSIVQIMEEINQEYQQHGMICILSQNTEAIAQAEQLAHRQYAAHFLPKSSMTWNATLQSQLQHSVQTANQGSFAYHII